MGGENAAGAHAGGAARRSGVRLTPVMEQYLRLKEEHPDALLFFRLGDFYEMFFEDAERAAALLDITLTTRSRKDEVPIPMCGVPYHAVQGYVARLLRAGVKVALCDQMEDPASTRGIVRREVVRVITPGTVTEEEFLDPRRPNYLAVVCGRLPRPVLWLAELSTGDIRRPAADGRKGLIDALRREAPVEVVLPRGEAELVDLVREALPDTLLSELGPEEPDAAVGRAWASELGADPNALTEDQAAGLGALRSYLLRTHRGSLSHLRAPRAEGEEVPAVLDETTRRNLELLVTTRGERKGSLLWALDETLTPMGARLLRQWLLHPLLDPALIGERLDAVEELLERPGLRSELATALAGIGDLERLGSRIATGRVQPRDLLALASALDCVGSVREALRPAASAALQAVCAALDPLPELCRRIRATLSDDPPAQPRAGGIIRPGFDPVVDEARALARDGRRFIAELEARERHQTGIQSLKVKYNQVFGYYIEVTRPNLHLVPERYRRKQTLANAERFVTPELAEYEAKIVGAEQRLIAREAELFATLVSEAASCHPQIAATAAALARADVLLSFANVAERHSYTRPSLTRQRRLAIEQGRHPVVERVAGRTGFVPNDCLLDPDDCQVLVLTGPNMAGKSTYLRQVALITLMAQIGSFVPAERAEIGIVDHIFTRIGASDNLVGGESTFMVEMKETAGILGGLTGRSLVILDEIGRGTSTFDGISIAWAVAEYLHEASGRPLVLFATHYHELTELERVCPRVRNASVAVREWQGEVLFLRRVVPGAASRSYGIEVARLAGVPQSVVERAREILARLEQGELETLAAATGKSRDGGKHAPGQLSLFVSAGERLARELAGIDVNGLTPVQALTVLDDVVRRARRAIEEES